MMSFTQDGQLDPALLKARDELFGIDTEQVGLAQQQAAAAHNWDGHAAI